MSCDNKNSAEALFNIGGRCCGNLVLMGVNMMRKLQYYAESYPNGANIIKKTNKKAFKTRTVGKKKYRQAYRIPPMSKTTHLDKEAIFLRGYYCVLVDSHIDADSAALV
ncbi:MAG: hypothetical protein PHI79_04615 [Sulfurovaceae bacterium]|nr:hypothetical protein [Sulfurovaceae bacterium]